MCLLCLLYLPILCAASPPLALCHSHCPPSLSLSHTHTTLSLTHRHRVFWYGSAQERQQASEAQETSRIIDAMLVARSDGMLLSHLSTFGYVVRALADGRPAPLAVPTYAFEGSSGGSTGGRCSVVEENPEPVVRNVKLLDKCGMRVRAEGNRSAEEQAIFRHGDPSP